MLASATHASGLPLGRSLKGRPLQHAQGVGHPVYRNEQVVVVEPGNRVHRDALLGECGRPARDDTYRVERGMHAKRDHAARALVPQPPVDRVAPRQHQR